MSNIRENYRKTNDKVKEEWFKYKEQYSGAGNPSITSFVAGWNSRDSEVQRIEDKLNEANGELLTYYNDWTAALQEKKLLEARVDRLHGQLQNCVDHLEHARRKQYSRNNPYDKVI